MEDDELIEGANVPVIYVDNFTKHITRRGQMRCVGYVETEMGKVIVVRLVWPEENTSSAIEDAETALHKPAKVDGKGKRDIN
jgi:hypothetical protein